MVSVLLHVTCWTEIPGIACPSYKLGKGNHWYQCTLPTLVTSTCNSRYHTYLVTPRLEGLQVIPGIRSWCLNEKVVSCRGKGTPCNHAFPRQLTTFSFKHQLLMSGCLFYLYSKETYWHHDTLGVRLPVTCLGVWVKDTFSWSTPLVPVIPTLKL